MNRAKWSICAIVTAASLCGCQSFPKDAGFDDVQHDISNRTGYTIQWNGRTTDDQSVAAAVAKMLANDLTADQAVQIALLNNHHLQATFEDLGIAQADLVQAGLLKNPVFDLGVRFPDRSPAATYLNFAVAEDFLDIALLPARKKLAAGQFDQAKAMVCHEVLSLVAQTSADFYAYQAARQIVELRQTLAQTAAASLTTATKLHDTGNLNDLDFANERAQAIRAQIDLTDAQAAADESREKVTDRMGLWGSQTQWTAVSRLPDIPPGESPAQNLEYQALQNRPDLAAARQNILIQARTLGLTADYRFFQQVDLGPEFERETDSQWRIGPTLSLPIPLFDQGQAKISRAQSILRQSEQRYQAMTIDVRCEVRSAATRLSHARARALLYRDDMLPVEQALFQQTQLQYNGMYTGVFQLLQARRDQIEATAQYIDALRDYWTAHVDLERAMGSRLAATTSTTQPTPTQGEHP